MEQAQKIALVKELRVGLECKIEEFTSALNLLGRGTGARELALARTKLQESGHWTLEAQSELGYKSPEEYQNIVLCNKGPYTLNVAESNNHVQVWTCQTCGAVLRHGMTMGYSPSSWTHYTPGNEPTAEK